MTVYTHSGLIYKIDAVEKCKECNGDGGYMDRHGDPNPCMPCNGYSYKQQIDLAKERALREGLFEEQEKIRLLLSEEVFSYKGWYSIPDGIYTIPDIETESVEQYRNIADEWKDLPNRGHLPEMEYRTILRLKQ